MLAIVCMCVCAVWSLEKNLKVFINISDNFLPLTSVIIFKFFFFSVLIIFFSLSSFPCWLCSVQKIATNKCSHIDAGVQYFLFQPTFFYSSSLIFPFPLLVLLVRLFVIFFLEFLCQD